ncbi:MAG: hypothetical protein V1775_14445 [Bacteroidota bacterium]
MMNIEVLNSQQLIQWLLEGDVAIQYQVHRDLFNIGKPELRNEIESTGWGKALLVKRNPSGHWGGGFYNPKWISSHYTLLDLKNLAINPDQKLIRETIAMILKEEKGGDGGLNPAGTIKVSDVCINGMALNYCCYFGAREESLNSIVDFLLLSQMKDGGFNCQSNRKGAVHGSLHTTLSVAEGFCEYRHNGYQYRLEEVIAAESAAREFILIHRLYKSDKTGNIIRRSFLSLSYPSRWKYDILRSLDYFRLAGAPYDARMEDAIGILNTRHAKDMRWPLHAKHPGKVHFDMETAGKPSRWNTLRALRVLKAYDNNNFSTVFPNII